MENLIGSFASLLGNNMGEIKKVLGSGAKGVDLSSATSQVISSMVSALDKNTQNPEGAASLAKALEKHDGSGLGDINSLLKGFQSGEGAGILKHIFGDKETEVFSSLSNSSGLNAGDSKNLFTMLAPLVLQMLGQEKKSGSLDAGGVSGLLSGLSSMLGGSDNALSGTVTAFLDKNKDGSIVDDVVGLVKKFFA